MVKSWRVQLWGLAVLALSCSTEPADGEYGVGVCTDGADNDGDGVEDCGDPDCQPEDVCGRASPLKEPDAGPVRPPEAGDPALPPAVPPPEDAGITEPSAQPSADAQVVDAGPADSGMPPSDASSPGSVCTPACSSNETCIDGVCVPDAVVFVELWDVLTVSVKMTRKNSDGECLDLPFECRKLPIPGTECECAPDPMVRVEVKRPGEEPMVAFETATALQRESHEWQVDEQLHLRREFEIVLTALDSDGLLAVPVFSCSVPADPDVLGTGSVGCSRTFRELFRETEVSVTLGVKPASEGTP